MANTVCNTPLKEILPIQQELSRKVQQKHCCCMCKACNTANKIHWQHHKPCYIMKVAWSNANEGEPAGKHAPGNTAFFRAHYTLNLTEWIHIASCLDWIVLDQMWIKVYPIHGKFTMSIWWCQHVPLLCQNDVRVMCKEIEILKK